MAEDLSTFQTVRHSQCGHNFGMAIGPVMVDHFYEFNPNENNAIFNAVRTCSRNFHRPEEVLVTDKSIAFLDEFFEGLELPPPSQPPPLPVANMPSIDESMSFSNDSFNELELPPSSQAPPSLVAKVPITNGDMYLWDFQRAQSLSLSQPSLSQATEVPVIDRDIFQGFSWSTIISTISNTSSTGCRDAEIYSWDFQGTQSLLPSQSLSPPAAEVAITNEDIYFWNFQRAYQPPPPLATEASIINEDLYFSDFQEEESLLPFQSAPPPATEVSITNGDIYFWDLQRSQPPPPPAIEMREATPKRKRTKFTRKQRADMQKFAESTGWRTTKREQATIKKFFFSLEVVRSPSGTVISPRKIVTRFAG